MKKIILNERLFFVLPFLLALLTGLYLVFNLQFIFPDAFSRSFHAYSVFFSNNPKFANIGFVWPPVPTLAALPLALIKPLNTYGLIGNVMSAFFLGIAAVYLNKIGKFFSLSFGVRLGLMALFILNPMILLYGANGMSEIIAITSLMATTYYLLAYLKKQNILDLIGASVATALGVMTRYEMAALIPAIILLLIFVRLNGEKKLERSTVKTIEGDLVLYSLPILFSLGMWVIANWAIMHNPFYFMTSVYSNTSQSSQLMAQSSAYRDLSHNILGSFLYVGQRLFVLFPAFFVFLWMLGWEAIRKHNQAITVTLISLPLSVILFHTLLLYQGQSFGWLRFFIYIIPASFVLCALLLNLHKHIQNYKVYVGLSFFLLFFSSCWTAYAMSDKQFGKEEHVLTRAITTQKTAELGDYSYGENLQIANYLKANITDGKILVDDFTGFGIIYLSGDTSLFVETIDTDFNDTLINLKKAKNVKYILVREHGGLGDLDAINRMYPKMFENGAGMASLEKDFGTWRLYKKN